MLTYRDPKERNGRSSYLKWCRDKIKWQHDSPEFLERLLRITLLFDVNL